MSWQPRQSADFTQQQIADETLLVDADGKAVHVLNPTAFAIWQRCDGQHTPADIAAALREAFAVSDNTDLAADVQQTLALLREKNLIQ